MTSGHLGTAASAPIAEGAEQNSGDGLDLMKEDDKQKLLRKQLLLIQKDTSLTPQQKALQMQRVMSNKQARQGDEDASHRHSTSHHNSPAGSTTLHKKRSLSKVFNSAMTLANVIFHKDGSAVPLSPRPTLESHQASATATAANPKHAETYNAKTQTITLENDVVLPYCSETLQKSFTKKGKALGCEHYARNCKLFAPCCQKWYPCRVCHDEANPDHALQRKEIKYMVCMLCGLASECGKECPGCKTSLGAYYCDACHLWEDRPDKEIYHCDKCGICRVGKGLDEDYFHCETCDVCLSIALKGDHKCIERTLHANCPICGDYLFESRQTVIFMPCGHSIHLTCHQDHIQTSYQCPLCLKSIGDMTAFNSRVEVMLEEHTMPEEYKDYSSTVLCNDCGARSRCNYHFTYHRCMNHECKSFNTNLLATYRTKAHIDGIPDILQCFLRPSPASQ